MTGRTERYIANSNVICYHGRMIICITGPAGAGKDTAAEYLAEQLNALHVSGGDVLRDMLVGAGLEPKKTALNDFGIFLRTHYGTDALFRMVFAKAKNGESIVNSGIRSPAEVEILRTYGGHLIYIDAPELVRHGRIAGRNRGSEAIDVKNLKEQDKKEAQSASELGDNLATMRGLADDVVMNDGSQAELYEKLDQIVKNFA